MSHPLFDIRIGTLVQGQDDDLAATVRRIADLGFESISITYWQNALERDLEHQAEAVRSALAGTDTVVSSLAVFSNPLRDDEAGEIGRKSWAALVERSGDFGCDIVAGFAGRVVDEPVPESIPRFREVFTPLAERAGALGVRLAFENCPMGGDWKRGQWNIAFNPAAWELMFSAVPHDNVGLEWEPAHQLCQLIDPLPQLDDWQQRIIHLHGKDASVWRDRLARHGLAGPAKWCQHRHPGFGDSDWTAIVSRLREHGFRGSIDIEGWHDPVYRGELEMTGQVASLRYLQACRGGQRPA